jgi:hypothetical protein
MTARQQRFYLMSARRDNAGNESKVSFLQRVGCNGRR